MSLLSDQDWEAYKLEYNKSYGSTEEEQMRRELVAKSKAFVDEHNKKYEAGETTFTCGLNHMSDYTEEERKQMCGVRIPPNQE